MNSFVSCFLESGEVGKYQTRNGVWQQAISNEKVSNQPNFLLLLVNIALTLSVVLHSHLLFNSYYVSVKSLTGFFLLSKFDVSNKRGIQTCFFFSSLYQCYIYNSNFIISCNVFRIFMSVLAR